VAERDSGRERQWQRETVAERERERKRERELAGECCPCSDFLQHPLHILLFTIQAMMTIAPMMITHMDIDTS
jgi:hypothetical protein